MNTKLLMFVGVASGNEGVVIACDRVAVVMVLKNNLCRETHKSADRAKYTSPPGQSSCIADTRKREE